MHIWKMNNTVLSINFVLTFSKSFFVNSALRKNFKADYRDFISFLI